MKLLGVEKNGALLSKTWLHTDGSGNDVFTTETTQDVAPVIQRVKDLSSHRKGKDMHHVAEIPANVVNDICYSTAKVWGVEPAEVFSELMNNKTDRANKVWRLLTQSRDYSKLQSKTYAV